MILPPTLGIRDIHLVAQHIPYDPGFLPRRKRLDHRHIAQLRQPLVSGQAPTIYTAEYLLQQLPEFSFTHAASLARPGYKPSDTTRMATMRHDGTAHPPRCHSASADAGVSPSADTETSVNVGRRLEYSHWNVPTYHRMHVKTHLLAHHAIRQPSSMIIRHTAAVAPAMQQPSTLGIKPTRLRRPPCITMGASHRYRQKTPIRSSQSITLRRGPNRDSQPPYATSVPCSTQGMQR